MSSARIQNEMNRLFNTFFDTPTGAAAANRLAAAPLGSGHGPDRDRRGLRPAAPTCPAWLSRTSPSSSRTTCSRSRASARPRTRSSKEGYYRVERAWGSFSRSLTLPEGVDPEAVQAAFDRGVLEVRIPKPEQRKPRKVSISVGGAQPTIEGAESAAGAAGAEHNGAAELSGSAA